VLLVDLVQNLNLLFVISILVVDRLQNGGEGARGESEAENANNHDANAKYLFNPGVDANIAVSDGGNGGNCEIKAGQVLLVGTQLQVAIGHPGHLGVLAEHGGHHPHAGHQVHHHEKRK
jgi:hypothetical protein